MKSNILLKSFSLMILCILLLFSFTGCISESFSFAFSHSPDNVRFMRVYNTFDSVGHPKDLPYSDLVCEIHPERYSDIMEKIEGYSFDFTMLLIANAPSPSFQYCGYILYIEYTDGESSVLDLNTRQNLDIDGNAIDPDRYCFYGYSEEFDELLKELAGESTE